MQLNFPPSVFKLPIHQFSLKMKRLQVKDYFYIVKKVNFFVLKHLERKNKSFKQEI